MGIVFFLAVDKKRKRCSLRLEFINLRFFFSGHCVSTAPTGCINREGHRQLQQGCHSLSQFELFITCSLSGGDGRRRWTGSRRRGGRRRRRGCPSARTSSLRRCGSWSSSRRWTAAGGSMRARCSTGPYAGTDDARNNFPLFYHFSSPLAFGCWRTQGTVHAFSRGRQLFIFVGPGS